MDKPANSQLELFSNKQGASGEGRNTTPGFLSRIRRYEKVMLMAIGFIVVGVISFSMGVEKGKRGSAANEEPIKQVIVKQPVIPAQQETAAPVVAQKEESATAQRETSLSPGMYTIQVASFQTKALALKEEQALKKKGHFTMLLSKKGYTVLCVGKFSDKSTARTLLAELKKRYGDCYIRRF